MFEYFGGVTSAVVPDNLKSGVTKADYYEPGINKTYQDFAEHYGVAVIPARVRKPKDKAKAEQGVQAIQRRALAVLRNQKFFSVAELNVALVELRERFNTREMKSYGASRKDLFLKLDKPALQALPVNKYEFARYKLAKVHYNYHVSVNGNFYSVPYEYRAEEVEVRIAEKSISIFRRSKRIAIHKRLKGKSQYSTVKEHMPEQHRYMDKWNPMRLIEWANRIGSQTQLQIEAILRSRQHPEQAYGSCLGILNLSKQHENFRLENACKVANELGSLSFKSIKNILENKVNTTDFTESRPVIHSNIRGSAQFH